jgi:hypothetical protein
MYLIKSDVFSDVPKYHPLLGICSGGCGGPEHPDSGFKGIRSTTQRPAKLAQQREEDVLPRVPGCSSTSDRCFSVHLARQVYRCFACRSHGNALDLWAAARRLDTYRAAINLCRATRRGIPSRAPSCNR